MAPRCLQPAKHCIFVGRSERRGRFRKEVISTPHFLPLCSRLRHNRPEVVGLMQWAASVYGSSLQAQIQEEVTTAHLLGPPNIVQPGQPGVHVMSCRRRTSEGRQQVRPRRKAGLKTESRACAGRQALKLGVMLQQPEIKKPSSEVTRRFFRPVLSAGIPQFMNAFVGKQSSSPTEGFSRILLPFENLCIEQ